MSNESPTPTPGSQPGSQLDWQAFRYLAGEMTADEADRFEERLANDQVARESLAGMVELTGAITAAESWRPRPAVRVSAQGRVPARGRWLAWVSIAAAACLAVPLIYALLEPAPDAVRVDRPAGTRVDSIDVSRELAHLWVGYLPVETADTVDEVGDEVADDWALVEEPAELLAPPSWMLAGLAAQRDTENQE